MMIVTIPINIMPTMRNFVNVGQALFAIEVHNGKTIVYDCGGESSLIVASVLPYILKKNSTIDILFISHYDYDHINGVQYLLRHCNVRHIVLPMVDEPFKFLPLINTPFMSFAYKFILNASRAVSELINELRDSERNGEIITPRVHYVEQTEGSYGDANITDALPIADLGGDTTIQGNRAIQLDKNDDWIYLPYNRAYMLPNAWEIFLDFLGLPNNSTCDDFVYNWRPWWLLGRRNQVKKAWHIATGISPREINDFSMTLYSGPAHNSGNEGCLFTGDYNAKKYINELYHFYIKLWNNIRVVQVPHHGSDNNFDKGLIISNATHVIPNKEHPYRQSDVKYQTVWGQIESKGEKVVGTWKPPY